MKNEELIVFAKEAIKDIETYPEGIPMPQATAFLTESGKTYVAVNDLDAAMVEDIQKAGECTISKLVTVWKDGRVDLPCFSMRKAVLELCAENSNTQVILESGTKSLSATMPA